MSQEKLSLLSSFLGGFSLCSGITSKESNQRFEQSKENELNTKDNTNTKRKPGRRYKAHKKNHNVNLKIIHSNTDGYTSKKDSINEIADNEKPDVITLNDTNLKGKLKVKVPNYFSFNKNREKFKGGVATVIANHLKHNTMKVVDGREGDEYNITRFDHTNPAINILNIYGSQEARTNNDEIEKSWFENYGRY